MSRNSLWMPSGAASTLLVVYSRKVFQQVSSLLFSWRLTLQTSDRLPFGFRPNRRQLVAVQRIWKCENIVDLSRSGAECRPSVCRRQRVETHGVASSSSMRNSSRKETLQTFVIFWRLNFYFISTFRDRWHLCSTSYWTGAKSMSAMQLARRRCW